MRLIVAVLLAFTAIVSVSILSFVSDVTIKSIAYAQANLVSNQTTLSGGYLYTITADSNGFVSVTQAGAVASSYAVVQLSVPQGMAILAQPLGGGGSTYCVFAPSPSSPLQQGCQLYFNGTGLSSAVYLLEPGNVYYLQPGPWAFTAIDDPYQRLVLPPASVAVLAIVAVAIAAFVYRALRS